MRCGNYKTMQGFEYHNKQIKYNMTGLLNEVAAKYPNDVNPNLNDPKYSHIVKNSAFNPMIMGNLATTLGIKDKILTTELWEDLGNGWAPAQPNSAVADKAVETGRGELIALTKNSTKINPDGSYNYPKKNDKRHRPGTEFVFDFGERLSTAIALKATKDPSVELEFRLMAQKVFEEKIIPEMTKLARIRTGKDGATVKLAKEIMVIGYYHSENRAEQPFSHFHVCAMNTALGYDDNLYSLSTNEIGKNIAALDELFMSSMKEEIEQKWGFMLEPVYHEDDMKNPFLKDHEKKVVSFDLPKEVIPVEIMEWRSKREKEIEAFLEKEKLKGREAKEIARLETRMEKTDLSPSELRAKWKAEFDSRGWTEEQLNSAIKTYKPKEEKVMPTMEQINDSFFRHTKDVAFTEYQYIAHVSKQLLPFMSGDEAKRIATKEFEENCVMALSKIKENGNQTQTEYFKDFLADKITNPIEYQSLQLQYMREVRFLHKEVIRQETYVMDSLKARDKEESFVIDKKVSEAFMYAYEKRVGFTLSKGQREAYKMMTTDKGAVCNIEGRAGAGKSTVLEAVKELMEAQGKEVWGISTSGAATKNLAESTKLEKGKFNNTTLFNIMLDSGKLKLNSKSIVLWDEAGMADSKTFYQVVKHINEAGAKLVLIGESEQLQSVGHGGLFRKMTEEFKTTKITEINRQKDQWQREMVEDFACGRAAKAVDTLYKNGKVHITDSDKERQDLIVLDYLNATDPDPEKMLKTGFVEITYLDHNKRKQSLKIDKIETAGKEYKGKEIIELLTNKSIMGDESTRKIIEEKLGTKISEIKDVKEVFIVNPDSRLAAKSKIILASKNDDVNLINEKIRDGLKAQGKLQGEAAKVLCNDGAEREFAIGDRIIMTATQKTNDFDAKKLNNSEVGEVIGFGRTASKKIRTLQVRMDDGQVIFLDAKKELSVNHGYASTVHKSQGQTKEKSFFYVTNLVDMHTAYVACSRHKSDMHLYFSKEFNNKVSQEMEDKLPTPNMLKVAEWIAKEKQVEFKAEWKESFLQVRDFLNENYKAIPGNTPEKAALDDIKNIVHAMGQSNYKKTSFDYEIQDGKVKTNHNELVTQEIENQKYLRAQAESKKEIEENPFRAQVAKAKKAYKVQEMNQSQDSTFQADDVISNKQSKAFTFKNIQKAKAIKKSQVSKVIDRVEAKTEQVKQTKKFTSQDFKKTKRHVPTKAIAM